MSKELLLEIGTEEIPARFIPPALENLKEIVEKTLREARLKHGEITVMGNPRRLFISVDGVQAKQPDAVNEITGPPKKAGYDADGNPTKAALGFAKSAGVDVSSLKIVSTDKGEYVAAVVEEMGRDAAEVLAEALPDKILSIPFPKSMRWMDRDIRFARPIHWILCILDGEVVPFEIDGIKSGNLSRGHRFMSPGAFTVDGLSSYMHQTRDNYTILDPAVRREMVENQIHELADSVGGEVLPNPGLLEEVSNLVEYPVAVLGNIDKKFLHLPKDVLVHSMREHQRYFSLIDKDGFILPQFITISNTKAEDMDVVRVGNERVLRARLSDAKFFFDEDIKHKLDDKVRELKRVVFQEKLGSTYDKVQRVKHMAGYVAGVIADTEHTVKDARRAAQLCKADLLTHMVTEFAELQGITGAEYAIRQGENPEVAAAIREHYMPRYSGDALPESQTGTALSIADKIDTIAGIFSVGKTPTGSEDPYALRRQALGIVAMIYKKGLRLSLVDLIAEAVGQLKDLDMSPDELRGRILDFFRQRVANQFTAEGYEYDTVDAVLAREFDDIHDARERVAQLSEFRKQDGFEPFIVAFKRVANIIPDGFEGSLDEKKLVENAEIELCGSFKGIRDDVHGLTDSGRYAEALEKIATVRPAVDKFFDDVLVMDKDESIKNNRLSLMHAIEGMFMRIADLTKIVVQ
jgi:glycyl-tRNA synthetase beta chain